MVSNSASPNTTVVGSNSTHTHARVSDWWVCTIYIRSQNMCVATQRTNVERRWRQGYTKRLERPDWIVPRTVPRAGEYRLRSRNSHTIAHSNTCSRQSSLTRRVCCLCEFFHWYRNREISSRIHGNTHFEIGQRRHQVVQLLGGRRGDWQRRRCRLDDLSFDVLLLLLLMLIVMTDGRQLLMLLTVLLLDVHLLVACGSRWTH